MRQSSNVRPQVISAKFECPACGNNITIPQIEQKFREPSRCSCGRRGRFKLLSKELVDAQHLILEESPEALEGGEQPKRLSVFLREDLVEPKMEKRTTPGAKVQVTGVIKEVPIQAPGGTQLTRFDLVAEANNIEPIEETYEDIVITPEDEQQIKQLANDPKVYEKLIKSIAPSIFGHEDIKGALVLQLMGGVRKEKGDGTITKGDIHILLVGDPGAAKSSMLTYISKAAPKARYVAGRSASSAGLTATVVKDEFLRGWALEAGAIVLANGGFLCLHPDSSVIVDNKITKIQELMKEEASYTTQVNGEKREAMELKGEVPCFRKKDYTVVNGTTLRIGRRQYKGKLLTITLHSGLTVNVTPNHQLLSGKTGEWIEAHQLKKGDSIMAPLKLPSRNKEVMIYDIIPDSWKVNLSKEEKKELRESILKKYKTLSEANRVLNINRHTLSDGKQMPIKKFKEIVQAFHEEEKWRNRTLRYARKHKGERLKITKVTPELAYVIGFILGNGYAKITKRRSQLHISQAAVNQAYLSQLMRCWKKTFLRQPAFYRTEPGKMIINGKEIQAGFSYDIFYESNILGLLYQKFTENNLGGAFMFNDEVLRGFIAGCADTDGYLGTKKGKKNNKQYLTQHAEFDLGLSKESYCNLLLLLKRFDCYATIRRSRNNLMLLITGRKDVMALKREIERYSLKAKRLEFNTKRTDIQSQSDKIPSFPVAHIAGELAKINTSLLVRKGIWSTICRYRKKTIQPSRPQLLKIKERLGEEINAHTRHQIDILCKRDYCLETIEAIKETEYDGYVYDLYVPQYHNFVADGIFVHNCLDEMDKMTVEDSSALHEALAQQTVTIAKANIQATLSARTAVLAAANPKLGRFDPYQPIASQIDLPPTLINRFDLIFPVRDLPNKEKDTKIAAHVLETQQKADTIKPEIPIDLFKKYIAYVRQKIHPKLTQGAVDEIREFYVTLRNSGTTGDEGIRPIPISARQLEALVRLAEGSARVRLSRKVTRSDAKKAISILRYCLMQVGFDYETGQIDIDRISTGIPASTRNKIVIIRDIINDIETKGKKIIPIEDIMSEASEKNITEAQVEEIIEKLKREGEVYEPRRGWISKI